ncbi:HAMP domain-containing sensor histidine kinase [Flammeovirgaceae bacterium SG7u.132]|nr:HAMP domain-containing sensor histidine kinase [Flammeovirgaceae bacterium SG7u.132]
MDDVDESLILLKLQFEENSLATLKKSDIPQWNKYNATISINKSSALKKDSLFSTSYFSQIEQEYEPFRELNSPIIIQGTPYTFSAKTNLLESKDLILGIVLLFFLLLLLMFLGLVFITKKLSQKLWKPFYTSLGQIEDFEIDKENKPRFAATSIEEFNRLNNSVEKLIHKNMAIYESQREFVENAAHELQTPIAVFQAKIDTLAQYSELTQSQAETIESLNESVARLNRLNKNLLLLSKIDKNWFSETSHFSIKNIIELKLDFFQEQALQKDISIETKLIVDAMANGNKVLAEVLFSNLFLNAIRHNLPNGKINIVLTPHDFTISNTGLCNSLSQGKLFNRFNKPNLMGNGSGLGLAIVKKIADLNGWEISYAFSNSFHSFSVRF